MWPLIAAAAITAVAKAGSSYLSEQAQREANQKMMNYLDSLPSTVKDQLEQKLAISKNRPASDQYNVFVKELQSYNKSFDPRDFAVPTTQEFKFDKTEQEFLNPYIDYRLKKTQEGIERSAANRGSLFSGGTGKELLEKTSEITDVDWENAVRRKESERKFEYDKQRQQYADIIANANRNLDLWKQKGSLLGTNVDAQGNLVRNEASDIDRQLGLQTTYFDTINAANLDKAKLQSIAAGGDSRQLAGLLGGVAGGASTFANLYASNPNMFGTGEAQNQVIQVPAQQVPVQSNIAQSYLPTAPGQGVVPQISTSTPYQPQTFDYNVKGTDLSTRNNPIGRSSTNLGSAYNFEP